MAVCVAGAPHLRGGLILEQPDLSCRRPHNGNGGMPWWDDDLATGTPGSPCLSAIQASVEDSDLELPEPAEQWYRLLTESSLGMPVSPWIHSDGTGVHLQGGDCKRQPAQAPVAALAMLQFSGVFVATPPAGLMLQSECTSMVGGSGMAVAATLGAGQGPPRQCSDMPTGMSMQLSMARSAGSSQAHPSPGDPWHTSADAVVDGTESSDHCRTQHFHHLLFSSSHIETAQVAPASAQTSPAAAMARRTEEVRTTVMLRNLPSGFSLGALTDCLDSQGFAGKYDFAYLPVKFDTLVGLSHAFLNMVNSEEAQRVFECMDGYEDWGKRSSNGPCRVLWNDKHQGLHSLVERYRNSPVMHENVPDECKPVLFVDCKRVSLPAATQKVKKPVVGKRMKPTRRLQ